MALDALNAVATTSATAPTSSTSTISSSTSAQSGASRQEADQTSVDAAVEELQSHLDSVTKTSEFRVDYLSELNVVTVRSSETGEVIRQLPSNHAVELARLVREGDKDAFNILDTFA